ncbi:tetratricopeptide repeat protein [Christiangramia fulva]|nr:tetratricopeptide repeat protein [Christiangramia fulva]
MKKKNKYNWILLFFIVFSANIFAQKENPEKIKKQSNNYIARAQDALSENDFAHAEAAYRQAIAKDPSNSMAKYNMGNLYYTKEKAPSATDRLKQAAKVADSKEDKHRIYHNLGNTFMKQKNYQEAVNAFEDALRNDPTDDETRYNLALAKKMLEKEKQNNKDQNQDQKNQDNKDKKDQQDQQNKDQNKDGKGGDQQNQDQKPKDEGENKKDKKEGDQNKDQEKEKGDQQKQKPGEGDKKQQQQPKPVKGQLSPQQIQNLLEAMNNEEKKVQDKINAEKAKGVKVKTEKDW